MKRTMAIQLSLAVLALIAADSSAWAKAQGTSKKNATVSSRKPASGAVTAEETVKWFKNKHKKVVSFIGFSGMGYQDQEAFASTVTEVLSKLNSSSWIVSTGATADGIGGVYPIAKRMGFETAGIVSVLGEKYGASPDCDTVHFIQDDSWGGIIPGTNELSPTSIATVEIADKVVSIGGGPVAADELTYAVKKGKSVEFHALDMNHAKGAKKGKTDFKGEAYSAWQSLKQ